MLLCRKRFVQTSAASTFLVFLSKESDPKPFCHKAVFPTSAVTQCGFPCRNIFSATYAVTKCSFPAIVSKGLHMELPKQNVAPHPVQKTFAATGFKTKCFSLSTVQRHSPQDMPEQDVAPDCKGHVTSRSANKMQLLVFGRKPYARANVATKCGSPFSVKNIGPKSAETKVPVL